MDFLDSRYDVFAIQAADKLDAANAELQRVKGERDEAYKALRAIVSRLKPNDYIKWRVVYYETIKAAKDAKELGKI